MTLYNHSIFKERSYFPVNKSSFLFTNWLLKIIILLKPEEVDIGTPELVSKTSLSVVIILYWSKAYFLSCSYSNSVDIISESQAVFCMGAFVFALHCSLSSAGSLNSTPSLTSHYTYPLQHLYCFFLYLFIWSAVDVL